MAMIVNRLSVELCIDDEGATYTTWDWDTENGLEIPSSIMGLAMLEDVKLSMFIASFSEETED